MKCVLGWCVAAAIIVFPLSASPHSFQGLRRTAHALGLKQQADKDFAFAALRQILAGKSHEAIRTLALDDPRAFAAVIQLDAWPRGAKLRVCFYPEPRFKWFEGARALVMKLYAEMLAHTTLAAADAGLCGDGGGDIRIVFRNDDDDWSEVGEAGARGAKPGEPTMGLATLEGDGPTPAALGITRHALLHSLGFQHGHPRPDTDCGFRPAGAVGRLFGWPAAAAQDAIDRVDPGNLCRASLGACASLQAADAKSLMRHQLDPRLFGDRQDSPCYAEAPDTELSDLDVKTLEALYPK